MTNRHGRVRATATFLALAVAAVGGPSCGDGAGVPVDAAPLDALACSPAGCDWLMAMQADVVARLAGALPIADGVTLAHRASVDERDVTRAFLLAQFAELGVGASLNTYATGANVVGELPATIGTAPGLVVVGAHFDSVAAGPGAADDGTGVAMVLALARYLRDVPVRTHTIAFVLYDQEEIGLLGSEAYVDSLLAASVDVVGSHAFDMLSFDGDGDRAIELWSPTPELEALYRDAGELLDMPIQPVTFSFSDHQSFLNADLPAVGVGEEFVADDHTPNYHQATDTFDNVDFTYLAGATRLAFAVLTAQVAE